VRGLDGEMAIEPLLGDAVDGTFVVIRYALYRALVVHVLAELGDHGREAALLQPARGGQRVGQRLAGHETTHGAAGEGMARQPLAEPAAG
jgi:hypothetical protein